jgi:hypothetical protein
MRSFACTESASENGARSLRVKQFTTSTACPRSSHVPIVSERANAASSRCGDTTAIFTNPSPASTQPQKSIAGKILPGDARSNQNSSLRTLAWTLETNPEARNETLKATKR